MNRRVSYPAAVGRTRYDCAAPGGAYLLRSGHEEDDEEAGAGEGNVKEPGEGGTGKSGRRGHNYLYRHPLLQRLRHLWNLQDTMRYQALLSLAPATEILRPRPG